MPKPPSRLGLVIFDLDGVVYRGARPVPGAVELIAELHAAGVAVRFATNNSMVTRAGYVERLVAMGIPVTHEEIVTSTSATVDHLRREAPGVRRVLAVGASGMVDELRGERLEVTPAADAALAARSGGRLRNAYDAVLVGLDPEFDFGRMAAAVSAIRFGALFIATNADRRYPTADGYLPGAGAMVAAIAAASDVEPVVIGKPAPGMFIAILAAAGVAADEAVVIGDNPEADIVAARRAGIHSILVLTGIADGAMVEQLDGERVPDRVLPGPREVGELLRSFSR